VYPTKYDNTREITNWTCKKFSNRNIVSDLLNPASKDVAVEKVGLPQKVTDVRTSHVTTSLSQTVYRLTRNEAQVTKQHNSDEEIYFQYYELISPPSKF
jgi:hypothetical protein